MSKNKKITIGYNDDGRQIRVGHSFTINADLNGIPKHKYDFAVYIGRFQPYHLGHAHVVENALKLAKKLIIIVGSHNKPIDWKNPWTSAERIEMIKASLTPDQLERVYFQHVEDRLYQNKEWEASIYDAVDSILMDRSKLRVNHSDPKRVAKICLVGYEKDDSSFYLRSFPKWTFEGVQGHVGSNESGVINATDIRIAILDYGLLPTELVPEGTLLKLEAWMANDQYKYIKEWYDFDNKYQKPYEVLPYGTNFYCADNVVFHSGHVLLIKRKANPGKGLWALPGGHINGDENAFNASLRELEEETGLKIPEKVLVGSFQGEKIFDHPERSLRGRCGKKVGRTVSISHCYVLNGTEGLPRVRPADDAAEAWWFTIAEVRKMRDQLFEDHSDQINYWLARVDDKKYF